MFVTDLMATQASEVVNAGPGGEASSFVFPVVGISFEGRGQIVHDMVQLYLVVFFEREPTNAFDMNAVKVVLGDGTQIGYVPRDIAYLLAPDLDSGIKYDLYVTYYDSFYDYTNPEVRVRAERRYTDGDG